MGFNEMTWPGFAQAPCLAGAQNVPSLSLPAHGSMACAGRLLPTLDVLTTLEGFEALEAEWNALFDRAARPHQVFLQYNWLRHWAHTYGRAAGRGTLAIIVGRINGRLAMVLPLVICGEFSVRQLRFMGEPVSQYGDVLAEEGEAADALIRSATEHLQTLRADVVLLRKVRADSRLLPFLETLAARVTDRQDAPCIDLPANQDLQAFLSRYCAKARKNRRRHRRRLAEAGSIDYRCATTGAEAASAIRLAIARKRHQLKQQGRIAPAYASTHLEEFMAAVAGDCGRPAGASVSWLTVDGTPIAHTVCFVAKSHAAAHITVYDPEFERFGPGILLLEDVIADALSKGVRTYDLLAPAARYKTDWATRTVAVCDHALPLTALGRAYCSLYLFGMKPRLKHSLQRVPRGLLALLAHDRSGELAMGCDLR